ncbi:MAG TPA: excinuclease ABC subunit UvrB, partial [Nitrospirae bacterium]|nr:excinuclease ABC subunit UvrB [Nitrospirota bacterium]
SGEDHQVLLGVTGSGKTFTIANVIEKVNRPTLLIAHNKTLAAQLYGEMKDLFPENAVEFFVSYYDYYQPEAYLPASDTFIDKDSAVNDDIDRLRHSATRAVIERRDTIVIASVSCIYGIGSPKDYMDMHMIVETGMSVKRDDFLHSLVEIQYARSDIDLRRGTFRVRGDVVEICPSFSLNRGLRVEFFGDEIDRLVEFEMISGNEVAVLEEFALFPNSHWITPRARLEPAMDGILEEMDARVEHFRSLGLEVEAQRIEQRTRFDLEMLREFGFCHGIENYSRHLSGRKEGDPPFCLIDYFPEDFLIVIDESHATVPQIGGMYKGDKSRKSTLIEYGFRLPSALDNRPLKFEEFEERVKQAIYVSATPSDYEMDRSGGRPIEQIVRPTGLLDPEMSLRPTQGQVDDLLGEIRERSARGERVLVTTLTKKMAEDLTEYYTELGVKARYLHSDIDTLERVEILRDLRTGEFDVLIGVNLLREGLDLPEVSLVAITDADKEGFLRSERSLIQTAGRAARNIKGLVIMYADKITGSMERAMKETGRRRRIQKAYNKEHGITPESIRSSIKDILSSIYESDYYTVPAVKEEQAAYDAGTESMEEGMEEALEKEMREAAAALEFELAAKLRNRIKALKKDKTL